MQNARMESGRRICLHDAARCYCNVVKETVSCFNTSVSYTEICGERSACATGCLAGHSGASTPELEDTGDHMPALEEGSQSIAMAQAMVSSRPYSTRP